MLKRFVSIIILVIIILIGYSEKNELLYLIKEGGTIAILIGMVFVAICVFFPVIPFPLLAGSIGAVFGAIDGLFISLSGAMIGTILYFFLCRYGFRDWAQIKLMKYPKLKEFEDFLNKNSFLTILLSRLIPVIPAPVVNIFCGLSKVSWISFFLASAIGKIPNIALISYAGASFSSNKLLSFMLYGGYLLLIGFITLFIVSRRISK
ncbi:MAG: TVP38/TMEM64 family protein [Bacillota bacterium]|nr:TVP38/TMEM64 family protein [Bacillota bacterium]